jgi:diamine N-acetyltransferase
MTNFLLESNTIKLRALEPEDIELLYTWENDESIWLVSNTVTPYSKHVLKKYIESSHLDIYETKQLRLIIELKQDGNRPIGCIDLFDFDPFHARAGVGILIASRPDRHKGFAREALELFCNYTFLSLKLHQLYCHISSNNPGSLKLFEQAGFQICGERKEWILDGKTWLNEYMLQKIRSEPTRERKG